MQGVARASWWASDARCAGGTAVGYPLKSFPLRGGVHWVFISTGQQTGAAPSWQAPPTAAQRLALRGRVRPAVAVCQVPGLMEASNFR